MRQKNAHGYPLTIPSLGLTVYPGEIIDHDVLLPGFEEVAAEQTDDDEPSEVTSPEAHPIDEATSDANHPAAPTEPAPDPATPGADPQEVTR